jgi:hypothetical protein
LIPSSIGSSALLWFAAKGRPRCKVSLTIYVRYNHIHIIYILLTNTGVFFRLGEAFVKNISAN